MLWLYTEFENEALVSNNKNSIRQTKYYLIQNNQSQLRSQRARLTWDSNKASYKVQRPIALYIKILCETKHSFQIT